MSAGLAPERLRVCMYLCICVACEKYVLLFSVYAPRERRISRQVRNEARVKTRGFSGREPCGVSRSLERIGIGEAS